jgi:hypothetical protein
MRNLNPFYNVIQVVHGCFPKNCREFDKICESADGWIYARFVLGLATRVWLLMRNSLKVN